MSYKNRLREYRRLIDLGREDDICQSLKDEFGSKKTSVIMPKPKELKKKGEK